MQIGIWTKNTTSKDSKSHVVRDNGDIFYYSSESRTVLHREDGPAYERRDGYKEWRLLNRLHREDGPAIEWPSGTKEWFRDGQRHREDGPAIEDSKGLEQYYFKGNRFDTKEAFEEYKNSKKSGWQPINTAPKDGTKVDLWVKSKWYGYHRVPDCSWDNHYQTFIFFTENGFFSVEEEYGVPTHWRPIPEGPS